MKQETSKQLTYWLGVAAVGLIIGLGIQFVQAWTEPSVAPPSGNVGAPLNTGGIGQTKVAALTLNCGTGVNCAANGTSAPTGLLVPNGNVGIGTMSPNNTIQVANLIDFDNSVYGTFLGYQAGYANTGNNNSFIGYQAGLNNTTGSSNSAMGRDALLSNTTGGYNSAMGRGALLSNTTGYNNSAMGGSALYSNTIGYNNTANGNAALLSNTAGVGNSAVGKDALRINTTGSYNSAMGFNALYFNSTGDSNVAMGRALYSNTTGSGNSAMGLNALESNTTGGYNSAMGNSALYSNTTGNYNAAMGHSALYSNTTGVNNSAMGENAGKSITTGNFNTFLGYAAGFDTSQKINAVNSMALGYGANTTADNQVVIGNSSVTQTLLKGNVGIGTTSPTDTLEVNGTIRGQHVFIKGHGQTSPIPIWTTSSTSPVDIPDTVLSVDNIPTGTAILSWGMSACGNTGSVDALVRPCIGSTCGPDSNPIMTGTASGNPCGTTNKSFGNRFVTQITTGGTKVVKLQARRVDDPSYPGGFKYSADDYFWWTLMVFRD